MHATVSNPTGPVTPVGLLCITGGSGTGKTSLVQALQQIAGIESITTITTRPRRPGEGKDAYHFTDAATFLQQFRAGAITAVDHYDGNWYGIPKQALQAMHRSASIVLSPEGARWVRHWTHTHHRKFTWIHATADDTHLTRRLQQRDGDDSPRLQTQYVDPAKQVSNADRYINTSGRCPSVLALQILQTCNQTNQ